MKDIPNLQDHKIHIKSNLGLDQRVYNAPLASQVAAIWLEDDSSAEHTTRDIIVHSYHGFKHRVQYYFGCYDPLHYPLLFPFGESSWHQGILKITRKKGESFCEDQDLINSQSIASALELIERETKGIKLMIKFHSFLYNYAIF